FDSLFRTLVAQSVPFFHATQDYKRRVVGIHALSGVINRASRLQDTDKTAPDFTCMTTAADVQALCPLLQARFQRVGSMNLKGIGDTDVFGLHRFDVVDVPALEKECRAYYAGKQ